jgi:hypothetical protein
VLLHVGGTATPTVISLGWVRTRCRWCLRKTGALYSSQPVGVRKEDADVGADAVIQNCQPGGGGGQLGSGRQFAFGVQSAEGTFHPGGGLNRIAGVGHA